jgi:predicted thioesterase
MAMDDIKPGLSYDLEETVDNGQTINRMGKEGADVLSTPSLLALMEWSSIKSTDHLLPDDRTTVGYAVDGMRHLAPTPIGASVVVKSVLTEVDGNKLTYQVEAFEGDKLIGKAIHKRAIVPIS